MKMSSDRGEYVVMRKGAGDAATYEVALPLEDGPATMACPAPVADRLDAVGAAVPESDWIGGD